MSVVSLCTDCRDLPGESRRTHGERVLCDRCALKPYGMPYTSDPADQLAQLLGLPDVAVTILGADIYGAGSRAAVEIRVSNGETLTFDQLREMTQPGLLAAELVACTGATPKLTKPHALRAAALVRTIARTHRTMTDNDAARDWGAGYLQVAQIIDFDLDDTRDRWGAFSQLNEVEPSRDPMGVPPPNLVLRHTDGTRLVRASWFGTYVRRIDTVSSREIPTRMSRVGWDRRGSEGRIKASRSGFTDTLQWSFYLVAEGWENDTAEPAGNGVTASGLVNARAQNEPLSRVDAVTDRYPVTTVGARKAFCDRCNDYVAVKQVDEGDDAYEECGACGALPAEPCRCDHPALGDPDYIKGYCANCTRCVTWDHLRTVENVDWSVA